MTRLFESILNELDCNERKYPNFDLPHHRIVKRGIWNVGFKRVLKPIGRFLGWTVVLTTAGVVGSNTAVWLDHYLGRADYVFVRKQNNPCKMFNVGCHSHLCWASCGTRRGSADWCFTKNLTPSKNYTTPFGFVHNGKSCNNANECDSCAECGSECHLDDGAVSIQ